jgi:hypothetical protein
MLIASIALFAIAAVLGLIILLKWMSQAAASKTVVYAHGLVAATGLAVLLYYVIRNPNTLLTIPLVTFSVATIFGFYMFLRYLQGKNSPLGIAYLHAALAAGAFVVLLMEAFS